jgi:hypothetical protein
VQGVSSVLASLNSSFQNALRNLLAMSLTINLGKEWSLNISLKNKSTTYVTFYSKDMENK